MKKNKVTVCTGTACFVMGGSELLLLEDELPPELKEETDVEGAACLGYCKKSSDGRAPFVTINGRVMEGASAASIIDYLRTLS